MKEHELVAIIAAIIFGMPQVSSTAEAVRIAARIAEQSKEETKHAQP